ncbi:hypothetical protein [Mesomycoplasma lagogenitalium]|uniref:DUF1410 domain-containing protein n=1 Tax=Mesomycoplasma lagogenitalium TaxID=171286 RepID=A0ABY8LSQ3_9BACT|nr:hypothetical protein [Mesomycoplasma lagogenitalium]WGI36287.1 hypothetical protein QEG99_02295 [Mesomycoplasma lagogenitalium]
MKSRGFKKILAIITLGFTGAAIGSTTIVPFIWRNWKTIQYYDVLDISQNSEKTTDTSVFFSFEFSDKHLFNLEKNQISVSILEKPNSDDEKVVQTGFAKYISGLRRWEFQSDLVNKLKAGEKYKIKFNSDDEKKKIKIINSDKAFVYTKANVLAFEFKTLSPSEKEVKVKFADNVKSLENKMAEIKYHFLVDDGNGKLIKTDQTTSEPSLIRNGESIFILKNLQPSRNYIIESVSYIDNKQSNGLTATKSVEIPWDEKINENVFTGEKALLTPEIPLYASNIQKVDLKTDSATVLVSFTKNTGESLDNFFTGRKAILEYKLKDTEQIFTAESQLNGSVSNFELSEKNNHKLQSGSIYEIISVKVEGANVSWRPTINKNDFLIKTKIGVNSLTIKDIHSKGATIDIEIISQDNKDDIADSKILLDIVPNSNYSIPEVELKLKPGTNNVYIASLKIDGLNRGFTHTVNSVKIKKPDNPFKAEILDFTNELISERNRQFTTTIGTVEMNLQGKILTNYNSASMKFTFDLDNRFINGKNLVLKYVKTSPKHAVKVFLNVDENKFWPTLFKGDESRGIFSAVAKAENNSVSFNLGGDLNENNVNGSNPLLEPGTMYVLHSIEFQDKNFQELNGANFSMAFANQSNQLFLIPPRIKSITYSDITETSAKVKIYFSDDAQYLSVDKTTLNYDVLYFYDERLVKLFYQPTNLKMNPVSTRMFLVDNYRDSVEFELTNLQKGTDYKITDLHTFREADFFYKDDLLLREDNGFSTLANNFEVQSINISKILNSNNSVNVNLGFNLATDLILVNKDVKVTYQEILNNSNSNTNEFTKSFTTTINENGEINYILDNLNPSSSYKIIKIETTSGKQYNFTFSDLIKDKLLFSTKDTN